MFGDQALKYVLSQCTFDTVLDIGCGMGAHTKCFQEAGKTVTTVDSNIVYKPDILGDFNTADIKEQYDLVWCCHVLEHQQNVGSFLKKIFSVLKDGGVLAITVPPMKPQIVGGHLTVWNAGLLAYNLILAGFDCSEAAVSTYGYNVSLVVKKKKAEFKDLIMDYGDIEKLSHLFPFPIKQGVDIKLQPNTWRINNG